MKEGEVRLNKKNWTISDLPLACPALSLSLSFSLMQRGVSLSVYGLQVGVLTAETEQEVKVAAASIPTIDKKNYGPSCKVTKLQVLFTKYQIVISIFLSG